MGVFTIPTKIVQGAREEEMEMTVDSGSLYTVVLGEALERLGVERSSRNIPFSVADNRILNRDVGIAWIRIDGEWVDELIGDQWIPMTGRVLEGPLFVVFGEESDEILLGAHVLQGFRLGVHPPLERLLYPKIPLSLRSRAPALSW